MIFIKFLQIFFIIHCVKSKSVDHAFSFYESKVLLADQTPVFYDKAKEFCMINNMTLPEIHDWKMQQILERIMVHHKMGYLWLGATNLNTLSATSVKPFRWETSGKLIEGNAYTHWLGGNPVGNADHHYLFIDSGYLYRWRNYHNNLGCAVICVCDIKNFNRGTCVKKIY